MDQFTIPIILGLLEKADPEPVSPTKEQLFFSSLLCKNLSDLCDTGKAILNEISNKGHPLDNLANPSMISLCESILRGLFSEKMFIEDKRLGIKPNWKEIQSFDRDRAHGSYRLYRCLQRNVKEKPGGKEICHAIMNKDTVYFSNNFYKIFADLPPHILNNMNGFKNLITCPYVNEKSRNYVWDFFQSLLDLVLNEQENIKMLSSGS